MVDSPKASDTPTDDPLAAPPARERPGLWVFASVAMAILTALLVFFMWRLGQEPLEFELQPDQFAPPAEQRDGM